MSTIGRATQGVKVMNLGDDDRVVAVAKIVEREDEEDEGETPEAPEEPEVPEEPVN